MTKNVSRANIQSKYSTAESAPISQIEPQDHGQTVHRDPMNGPVHKKHGKI